MLLLLFLRTSEPTVTITAARPDLGEVERVDLGTTTRPRAGG